jgi:hypothetical protein
MREPFHAGNILAQGMHPYNGKQWLKTYHLQQNQGFSGAFERKTKEKQRDSDAWNQG